MGFKVWKGSGCGSRVGFVLKFSSLVFFKFLNPKP